MARLFSISNEEELEQQAQQELVNTANNKTSETPEVIDGEKASNFSGTIVIAGYPSLGKDLCVDTKIRIPNGWKRMGDIEVGDLVITKDGTSTKVTGVFPQGLKPTWRVEFEDGRHVYAGLDHQWKVWCKNFNKKLYPGRYKILTTRDLIYIRKFKKSYINRLYIDLPDPEKNEDKDFYIDPYILGCYLGDGNCGSSVVMHISDEEVIKRIESKLDVGYSLTVTDKYKDSGCYTVRIIRTKNGPRDDKNKYLTELIRLGLWNKTAINKFIPEEYLNGSEEQRWELLRGLMDTDGCVSGVKEGFVSGTPSISTSSLYMADGIKTLVRSLGGHAKLGVKLPTYKLNGNKIISYNPSYRLTFRFKDPTLCCTRPSRLDRLSKDYMYGDRLKLRIKDVAPYCVTETQCISVEHPSELYICGDYIVTHNTSYCKEKSNNSLDLESSIYSRNQDGTMNEEFPGNYINTLKWHLVNMNWKYIFTACHAVVRDTMKNDKIQFVILYPTKDRKEEILKLCRERGNHEDFINKLSENWDAWISQLEQEPNAYALGPNEFISNELFETKLKFLKR